MPTNPSIPRSFASLAPALLALTCLAFATAADAQYAERLPKHDSYGEKVEIRYAQAYGDEPQRQFEAHLPRNTKSAPVVICWFGGAFWARGEFQLADVAAYFAARGFAAITPNYFLGARDGSRAAWPQAVYDAKSAVRFVRSHADELGIDPDRIFAFGYSSGAYLAMMVGFTPNLTQLEGPDADPAVSSRVSAVVEVAGVCDRRRDVGIPLSLLGQGYQEKWDLRVATSPVIYISPKTVPVYILHGRDDQVADISCATQLADALNAANVPHVLRLVESGHSPITARELDAIIEWLKRVP